MTMPPVTPAEFLPAQRVRLLGVRHHGPGSARAIRAALDASPPDIVLIEGPADADPIAQLAGDPEMRPPVAMLGYSLDRPERAVFYPFASFSPEWVALTWAIAADVPVRFIDLPVRNTLAEQADQLSLDPQQRAPRPIDPIGELALAAGYDDAERWWEDVVEHRSPQQLPGTIADPFVAIGEAMQVLRSMYDIDGRSADPTEQRREAQMRSGIRAAAAEGHLDIVVVCGAWHMPALRGALDPGRARQDAATLRGMAKVKVAVTWVPWTHRRLASATGYGAGVTAPGWYDHLYRHGGPDVIARWFALAAHVLRAADHSASAADVVDATRLATALAALRGRPLAGLSEVDDAARAVFGQGGDLPMRLISSELVVGDRLGAVPAATPMVPLARNLAVEQRRCRLKPDGTSKTLELDLRQSLHLQRSQLLHRLAALDIGWGRQVDGRRSAGTFRETWQLRWEPEFELRLVEASALGTTVVSACLAALDNKAGDATELGELTMLVEVALLAGLDDAVPNLLRLVEQRASISNDIARLMEALPTLARTIRYGDVRNTDASALHAVVGVVVSRISAGLAVGCTALDDEGSAAMADLIRDTVAALSLLGDSEHLASMHHALAEVGERDRVHGLIHGLAARVLADAGVVDPATTERRVSNHLSIGAAPPDAAAFVEGFLGGSGTVLVHDPMLLGVIDRWLASLTADGFTQTLPLLRRSFGSFDAAERRSIGQRLRTGQMPGAHRANVGLDPERVAAGLSTVAALLGRRT
jgi:Family of unknown function (DUF5682)